MWLRAGRGGRGRALPDHEQDAGGAEICCRPDRRPGMTQDLAGAAPARGRSPAVDRVGSSRSRSPHPRALCGRRSASHACGQRRRVVRRAESRRARCARSPRAGGVRAVAARWWATGHRGERGASEEHTGQCVLCATLKSLSQTRKTQFYCESDCVSPSHQSINVSPRRQQTLQWSASARRARQVVLRFEKPPAFLSHRLVQLRLDRWQRKASRRIRDHRGWTPRRPALRRTPPNHHAGASSQRVSRCTPDGQRAPMAAWARRAPWPACRYEAQLLGRGAP